MIMNAVSVHVCTMAYTNKFHREEQSCGKYRVSVPEEVITDEHWQWQEYCNSSALNKSTRGSAFTWKALERASCTQQIHSNLLPHIPRLWDRGTTECTFILPSSRWHQWCISERTKHQKMLLIPWQSWRCLKGESYGKILSWLLEICHHSFRSSWRGQAFFIATLKCLK